MVGDILSEVLGTCLTRWWIDGREFDAGAVYVLSAES